MRTSNFYFLIVFFLFITGCNKPLSTPETLDPIYLDLLAQADKATKDIDGQIKELDGYKAALATQPDNHFEKKLTKENIQKTTHNIDRLKQEEKYFRISAESRQIYSRKQYLEYYKEGKTWPPKEVFQLYEENKKTRAAYSRNWTRGMASKAPKKEEKPKAAEH